MAAKIYWDNFAYWSFTCHYFQQDLCKVAPEEHHRVGEIGQRFLQLTGKMQLLFKAWAELAPEGQTGKFLPVPTFPSVLVDCHIDIAKKMSFEETLDYMRMRLAQGEEIVAELVLRVVQLLGPDHARHVLQTVDFPTWNIRISKERLDAEDLPSVERRRAIPELARDVERTLGRAPRHERAAEARALLLAADAAPTAHAGS